MSTLHVITLFATLPQLFALLMYPPVSIEDECMKAMCEVDSGCLPTGCDTDSAGRLDCGYFRLNVYQYRQCYEPGREVGETHETAWRRCVEDYECSETCVQTLTNRYKLKCYGKGPCQTTARIKNGGASGCRTGGTLPYWQKVLDKCPHCD